MSNNIKDEENVTKSKKTFTNICRVEHVFRFIERTMGVLVFSGARIPRAKHCVALT